MEGVKKKTQTKQNKETEAILEEKWLKNFQNI